MLGALTNTEIEDVLARNVIGRIGCCDNLRMFVVPISYAYDGDHIIGHTVEGLKTSLLRKNPECCFEVDEMKSLSEWQSVVAWGTYEELQGEDAARALETLLSRLEPLAPGETSRPKRMGISSQGRTQTLTNNPIIYRIQLKEKTGRFERP